MKKTLLTLAVTSVLSTGTLAEISANISATSNYVWRGATQTDDGAAVQGGVDYSAKNGLYAGTWVSNINSDGNGSEVDIYFGFTRDINDFNYDVGAIRYIYPSDNHKDADFSEIYATGGYKFLSLGLAYTVDGDADEDDKFSSGDLYSHIGLSYDLPQDWNLGLTFGNYDFDTKPVDDSGDYTHVQLDITKSVDKFGDFTLSFSKADYKADLDSNSTLDDGKVFVTWSKTF